MPTRLEPVDMRRYHERLPLALLIRYLVFLERRPISRSNQHYLQQRLKGLKTLGDFLPDADIPQLRAAVQQLRALNAANFYRLVEGLEYALTPLMHAVNELPRDIVVSDQPPTHWLNDVRRVLLVLGPGIGIGDESMLFPLPTWLKSAQPTMHITVLSAYAGLWSWVNGVDAVQHYESWSDLIHALRGEAPYEDVDLVFFADFERPDLHQAICHESRIARFVELSLGAQSLFVADNRQHWLYRARRPSPYFANYYYGLEYLLRWLGLSPSRAQVHDTLRRRQPRPPQDVLQIYVNPFTSKYDPSEAYWSFLLSALFAQTPARQIHVVVDRGPNATTERFAMNLIRSTRGRTQAPIAFDCSMRSSASQSSFDDIFARIERAHVVICSDSFAAHVAPLFGCTTLVVATPALENWRAPYASSYYFRADAPLAETVRGMQAILSALDDGLGLMRAEPPLSESELRLDATTRTLQALFDAPLDGDGSKLGECFSEFLTAHQSVVARLACWPPELRALVENPFAEVSSRPRDDFSAMPDALKCDWLLYCRDHWQQWQNTNLRKYLGMTLNRAITPAWNPSE